ncbi:MAG: aminoacyl-tRNA hydrolase [Micromonosporaceae bacterium]|nr:aminoacyl-tRNA hydrolase [Micromonosporaceae bacterium]
MDDDVRVSGSVVIPAAELSWRFSRSSGPGGQGVNTADSRVELSFDLARTTALGPTRKARALDRLAGRLIDGVLTIAASEHRSQLRNREAARARLAALIADAIAPPPPPRRPTKPRRGAVRARLDAKTRRGRTKSLRRKPTDD